MKKVSFIIQADICTDYYLGMKYKDIMAKYGVNRWNIQAALSRFDMETDRIKSPPRLPGSKALRKIKEIEITPLNTPRKIDRNFILEDDLDTQELYDLDGTEDDEFEDGSYLEIDISNNDEVRYVRR